MGAKVSLVDIPARIAFPAQHAGEWFLVAIYDRIISWVLWIYVEFSTDGFGSVSPDAHALRSLCHNAGTTG